MIQKIPSKALPLGLVLLSVLLFSNTLGNGFVSFDDWWLVHNPQLVSWLTPSGLFQTFFDFSYAVRMEHGAEYLPIRDVLAALQFWLFGENPFFYHVVQIVLFSSLMLFFYGLFQDLNLPKFILGFSFLWFVVHPIHVEPVAWLTSFKDLLSGCVMGFSLWAYARGHFKLSWVLMGIGLGTKYQVLIAPLFLPWIDHCLGRKFSLRRYVVFGLISLFGFLLAHVVGGIVHYGHVEMGLGILDWIQKIPVLFHFGFSQWLSPFHLQIFYPWRWPSSWADYRIWAGLFEISTLVWFGIRTWKTSPVLSFGVSLILIGFIPILRAPEIHMVADRYLLIPSVGFSVLMGWLFSHIGFPKIRLVFGVLIFGILSFLTIQQNRIWASSLSLWENASQKTPVHFLVQLHLARSYREKGDWEKAATGFRNLIESLSPRDPNYVSLFVDLGFVEIQKKNFGLAEESLRKALALDPSQVNASLNLGVALAEQRKWKEAQERFERLVELSPKDPQAHFNLARVLIEQKKIREARKKFETIKALFPKDPRTFQLEEFFK